MKCPHCQLEVNATFKEINIGYETDVYWQAFVMHCPNPDCKRIIIDLGKGELVKDSNGNSLRKGIISRTTVMPFTSGRPPAPEEVEELYARDYEEACLTLAQSPKASAALSRRCLQNILREKAGVKKSNLAKEIDEVIDNRTLTPALAESLLEIKSIANFNIYSTKSTAPGEIVDAEPEEAEWMLDVLELMFDLYFVQPAKLKAKREALNKKLTDSGKSPLGAASK